jgi:hypothetical protein
LHSGKTFITLYYQYFINLKLGRKTMRDISRTKIIEAPMTSVEVGKVMKNTFRLIKLLESYDRSEKSRKEIENATIPLRHIHLGSVTTWELVVTTSWILDRLQEGTYLAGDLVSDLRDNIHTLLDPEYNGDVIELLKSFSSEDIQDFIDDVLGDLGDLYD